MSTQPPLTEAEQAAAGALAGDFECTWHIGCDEECHADRARAVVAAVRIELYREARDRLTNECDSPQPHIYGTLTACESCKAASRRVQDLIDADEPTSVSRPTSKETDR